MNFEDLTFSEKEGFKLIAPRSYFWASEDIIHENTGGCGPGKWGDLVVPDTLWGESVFLACQIHDWMYFIGKTLEDKKLSDLCFLVNMVLLIDDGEVLDIPRLFRVIKYYIAVSRFGNKYFLEGSEGFKEIKEYA